MKWAAYVRLQKTEFWMNASGWAVSDVNVSQWKQNNITITVMLKAAEQMMTKVKQWKSLIKSMQYYGCHINFWRKSTLFPLSIAHFNNIIVFALAFPGCLLIFIRFCAGKNDENNEPQHKPIWWDCSFHHSAIPWIYLGMCVCVCRNAREFSRQKNGAFVCDFGVMRMGW